MPRFVILRHDTPPDYQRPVHWDLMLETDAALATWALPREPVAGVTMIADVLGDHRIEFLDYEGPLSGNRGEVTRWDQGTFELLPATDDRRVVCLSGSRFIGQVSMRALSDRPGKVEMRFEAMSQ